MNLIEFPTFTVHEEIAYRKAWQEYMRNKELDWSLQVKATPYLSARIISRKRLRHLRRQLARS